MLRKPQARERLQAHQISLARFSFRPGTSPYGLPTARKIPWRRAARIRRRGSFLRRVVAELLGRQDFNDGDVEQVVRAAALLDQSAARPLEHNVQGAAALISL
jgi:hypothetical protein